MQTREIVFKYNNLLHVWHIALHCTKLIKSRSHTRWDKSRYTVINYILFTYFWPTPYLMSELLYSAFILRFFNDDIFNCTSDVTIC